MKNAKDLLGQDAPLQSDLGATLLQLSRAAKSITALVDYLERHPESSAPRQTRRLSVKPTPSGRERLILLSACAVSAARITSTF